MLRVTFSGQTCRTVDWSLGGLKIDGALGLSRGEVVTGEIAGLPSCAPGAFEAEVVRVEADGIVALRFLALAGTLTVAMGDYEPG